MWLFERQEFEGILKISKARAGLQQIIYMAGFVPFKLYSETFKA
jgi:hypothetical protein